LSTEDKSIISFILSLIAGVFILTGSGTWMMWTVSGMPRWGGMMGMMAGWQGMMGVTGFAGNFFWGMSIVSLVSGLIIILGALMLFSKPDQTTTWGTIILIFSLLSLFGMGGFIVGALLGVAGGLLALTGK
jgi:hypothetical protein